MKGKMVRNLTVGFVKGVVKVLQSLNRQMRVFSTLNWDQLKARGKDAMQWDLVKIILIGVTFICIGVILKASWSFGWILCKLVLGWTGFWTGFLAYRICRDTINSEIYKSFYIEEKKVRHANTATVED